jgi:hypothetical protein
MWYLMGKYACGPKYYIFETVKQVLMIFTLDIYSTYFIMN